MNLALSNFAWDTQESEETFDTLKKIGITSIEGVLSKLNSWEELSNDKITEYKSLLDSQGILILSLQSLFYGVKCDSILDEDIFISHFSKLIEYSKLLSVNVLVFGSPSLRKKSTGWDLLLPSIFKKLDLLLDGTGIQISIEPNSKIYGGEYFFTVPEIVDFITLNQLKNIKTMIDTHNIILEDSDPIKELEDNYEYINHIHISEKKLSPINNQNFHLKFSNQIKELGYDKTITYEVMKCENIMDSVKNFYEIYK
jgi:sugar phosphate isomerase/epimerase